MEVTKMKRWIRSTSQIGTYNGVPYGIEDDGDQRYYFVDNDGEVHYAELEDELFSQIDDIVAASVTEPSAKEYGEAISQSARRADDRYSPFKLKRTFFNRTSVNSTGRRISLPEEGIEYIADNGGKDSWSSSFEYKLYGPFNINEIRTWSQLFTNKPIASFKTLDKVMNWMFENVDYVDYDD